MPGAGLLADRRDRIAGLANDIGELRIRELQTLSHDLDLDTVTHIKTISRESFPADHHLASCSVESATAGGLYAA